VFRLKFELLNEPNDFIKASKNDMLSFKGIFSKKCFKATVIVVSATLEVGIAHCDLIVIS